jgi:hypothetical protein
MLSMLGHETNQGRKISAAAKPRYSNASLAVALSFELHGCQTVVR